MRNAASVAAALVIAMSGTAGIAEADPMLPYAPRTTIDGDGTYAVATDIAPGTYSSVGPVGDSPCYWNRLNGITVVGELRSFLASQQ